MKTEWDDAPMRLWQTKNSNKQIGLGLVVFCVLSAGVIFIGSKFIPKEPTPVSQESTPYEPRYDFSKSQEQEGPTAEELFWAEQRKREQAQRHQKAEVRQTVFNDSNYEPKGAINVVSTEGIRKSDARQQQVEKERKAPRRDVEHSTRWIKSWNGGTNYKASWTAINNYIDGGSVCKNFKRGSIEYRECRKAAKQHFHAECRTWRARYSEDREDRSDRMKTRYCSAASSFSPMG